MVSTVRNIGLQSWGFISAHDLGLGNFALVEQWNLRIVLCKCFSRGFAKGGGLANGKNIGRKRKEKWENTEKTEDNGRKRKKKKN